MKKDFTQMKDATQVKDNQKKKPNFFLSTLCAALIMIEGIAYGKTPVNNQTEANKPAIEYKCCIDDKCFSGGDFLTFEEGEQKRNLTPKQNQLIDQACSVIPYIKKLDEKDEPTKYVYKNGRINEELKQNCGDYLKIIGPVENDTGVFILRINGVEKKIVDLSIYKSSCANVLNIAKVQQCIDEGLKLPKQQNKECDNILKDQNIIDLWFSAINPKDKCRDLSYLIGKLPFIKDIMFLPEKYLPPWLKAYNNHCKPSINPYNASPVSPSSPNSPSLNPFSYCNPSNPNPMCNPTYRQMQMPLTNQPPFFR